ncbi:hypothetical protein CBL_11789 [Carabus blaptoides fortunei]
MSSGHVSAERHAADVQIAKEIDTGPHAGTGTGIHYAESVADRDAHTHPPQENGNARRRISKDTSTAIFTVETDTRRGYVGIFRRCLVTTDLTNGYTSKTHKQIPSDCSPGAGEGIGVRETNKRPEKIERCWEQHI